MSLRYRRLDSNHDPVFGQGKADYLSDLDAVAQAIKTRLLLFTNEWWEDLEDGLGAFTDILGKFSGNNRGDLDKIIQERISGTTGVTGISSVSSNYDAETRQYSFSAVVDTEYGQLTVTNTGA